MAFTGEQDATVRERLRALAGAADRRPAATPQSLIRTTRPLKEVEPMERYELLDDWDYWETPTRKSQNKKGDVIPLSDPNLVRSAKSLGVIGEPYVEPDAESKAPVEEAVEPELVAPPPVEVSAEDLPQSSVSIMGDDPSGPAPKKRKRRKKPPPRRG